MKLKIKNSDTNSIKQTRSTYTIGKAQGKIMGRQIDR